MALKMLQCVVRGCVALCRVSKYCLVHTPPPMYIRRSTFIYSTVTFNMRRKRKGFLTILRVLECIHPRSAGCLCPSRESSQFSIHTVTQEDRGGGDEMDREAFAPILPDFPAFFCCRCSIATGLSRRNSMDMQSHPAIQLCVNL